MSGHLGLDVGTTTVTAVVVDRAGQVVAKATAANDAEITRLEDKQAGRSEWDPTRILEIVRSVLTEAALGVDGIEAIGVTGQMHGMLLVDDDVEPIGAFIGWQDQRAAEGSASAVAALQQAADKVDPEGRVCRSKAGYLGATLHWLQLNGLLPKGARATFLPDYVSAHLTNTLPVTDATNAAGSGLFDVVSSSWHQPLLDQLGLSSDVLPQVVDSGVAAGFLADPWSGTGIDTGIPVSVSCGDNQASFLGSVRDPESSVLINVGTGGQVSVSASRADVGPGLEARSHVDGEYILVGAGLVGGRTYAWLRDFYLEVGKQLFGVAGDGEDVYARMTELASTSNTDSGGLLFEPLFTGTREEPQRRGKIEGIGSTNFGPAQLTRALMEGVIGQFRRLYQNALDVGAGERSVLVGSGNGIRKNPVLREIAESQFGSPMRTPVHTEEAAFGAALQASVLSGMCENLESARELIRYV